MAEEIQFLRRSGDRSNCPWVLLHGVGSNAHSFEPLVRELPSSVETIAWNAPGYGGSKPLAEASPAPLDYAAALAFLLDQLDVSRVVLVGHSLGALFAASFAAAYPLRVAALALLSPALGYRVRAGEPLPITVQQRIDELDALGPVAFSKKRAARLVGDPALKPHVVSSVERAMAAIHPRGYAQAVRALGAGDLIADLSRTLAPALVAVGSKDLVAPPANAEAARDALHGKASYHQVEGAGHALPQEEPLLVANLLTRFMEERADA